MTNTDVFGPLVDPAWLLQHLPEVRVIDVRWYLSGRRAVEEYNRGHIPGAVFLDLDRDLTGSQGPGRHPIPEPARFERAMRSAGVNSDSRVVAYDDTGGSIAARLWWLLRYYGHERVAVLDGGLQAWIAAGGTLTTAAPTTNEGTFRVRPPRSEWVVDKTYVHHVRRVPDVLLLDARAPERYRGEHEPIDARPGHIPGARNAPWTDNLKEGRFKSAEELRARYTALGADRAREVIVYCGSGVTACHDLLAMELAGIRNTRLYEGSWSDWSRDPSLPAATGED